MGKRKRRRQRRHITVEAIGNFVAVVTDLVRELSRLLLMVEGVLIVLALLGLV